MYLLKLYKPQNVIDEVHRELNEDVDVTERLIETIKTWLAERDYYIYTKTNPDFILRFLRVAKYNCMRAQEMIENYWISRTFYKDFFDSRHFKTELMVDLSNDALFVPMPYLDHKQRRIVINRIGTWDLNRFSHKDIAKYIIRCLEVLCEDPIVQIHGVCFIVDLEFPVFNLFFFKFFFIQLQGGNFH
jgi:hypothetical protein